FERSRIVGEIVEGRPDHRLEIAAIAPGEIVEVRHQAIAEFDQGTHRRKNLRMHPWLVRTAVVVPGVYGKARHEDAELHPTREQLRIRPRARETANIVTDVRDTG